MIMKNYLKLIAAASPLLLLFMDPPQGMTPQAWGLFPFYAFAILGIMLQAMSEAAVMMIALGAYAVIMRGHGVALSGFSLTMTWLVVGAFVISQAFQDTNLGRRIAYWMIGKFGRTSLGLGYAAAFSDAIIAPVTPSNAARTGGIIAPIFVSISQALGSTAEENPRRIGAYLMQLLYIVSMITGITFLTAYAANTVIWQLTKDMLGLEISWLQWTTAFCEPSLAMILLAPWLLHKVYKPEIGVIDNKALAAKGLAELGPMSRNEKFLLFFFLMAIVGWATGSYTKINSTAIVLGLIAAFILSGVLSWKRIATNGQVWSTLVWYGGILGLAGALNKFKFFDWMAGLLQANVDFSQFSQIGILIFLCAMGTLCRYLFVSCGAYMASVVPVQYAIGLAAGLPHWEMFLVFVNVGVMGALVTHYANAAGPVLFGQGYVPMKRWWANGLFFTLVGYAVYAIIGIPWWAWLGLLSL